MRLFIAGLATETNTFAPMPTGSQAFEETFVSRTPTSETPNLFSAPLHEWRRMGEERGWEVTEGLCAAAQPSGITVRQVYEAYRDEIVSAAVAAKPDIVLLSMHGAMIADGYDDCEGDTLAHIRNALGADLVLGLEIDPHNHLTDQMMDTADLIVCYKEYPHTDSPDRARELFVLAERTKSGEINPVMRDYDCKMIAMYQTPVEPMRSFVDDMMAREGQGGVLSLSLSHGFPWGDCERVGTRMLAITDGNAALAEETAAEFGTRLWGMRDHYAADWPDIDGALDRAVAAPEGPIVLADFADNAGAGAPADSTFVLKEVLDRGLKDVALGIIWDPVSVMMAENAGVGATLQLRLGGKTSQASGDPLDITAQVKAIKPDMWQMMGETGMPMGTGVLLDLGGVHVVINNNRSQVFHPSCFRDLGLDLEAQKIIVVKSSQHFYAGFAPIAKEVIYIRGPGAVTPDFANIPFTKRDPNYWPRNILAK